MREYLPGAGWLLVARGALTVVVPAGQEPGMVARLWDAVAEDSAGLTSVLDVLAASGLSAMPPFGVVEHGEQLRVLVRGDVRAAVSGPEGKITLSGDEVGTWLERAFPVWDRVELAAPDAPGGAPVPLALPLLAGAVAAESVRITAAGGAAAHGAATRDAAPVPEAAASPSAVLPPRPLAPSPAVVPSPEPAPPASEETLLPGATTAVPSAEPSITDQALPSREPTGAQPAEPESTSGTTTTTTGSYDHLWGTTVLRSVEDAAVRASGDEEPAEGAPQTEATGTEAPQAEAPETGAPGTRAPAPDSPQLGVGGQGATRPDPVPHAAPQRPAPGAWTPPSLLIDAVPRSQPDSPEASERAARAESQRSITSELFGDHDGETVMRSELEDGQADGPAAPAADLSSVPSADGVRPRGQRTQVPLVLGRRCGEGHANPPSSSQCATCGLALEGEPEQLERPPLGRVVFSTGEVVDLVQPVVVGRQPSVSRVASGGMPRLVSVMSPSGDISRNHLEVRLEGWHVMLRDLKATNGTVLERPGAAPRRLAQGEMVIVLDGDVADLGDGVTLRFEAVP